MWKRLVLISVKTLIVCTAISHAARLRLRGVDYFVKFREKSNICSRSDEQGLFAKANSVLNISLVRFVSIGKLRYRRDSLMICLRGLILVLTGLILAFCDDSAWVFSNLKDTWLILPAVICSDKRLSHACLRTYLWLTNLRTAHYNSYNLLEIEFLNGYLR